MVRSKEDSEEVDPGSEDDVEFVELDGDADEQGAADEVALSPAARRKLRAKYRELANKTNGAGTARGTRRARAGSCTASNALTCPAQTSETSWCSRATASC